MRYVIIREMRPHLTGYNVPKDKLKKFLKEFRDFTSEVEITVMEGDKVISKIKKKPSI